MNNSITYTLITGGSTGIGRALAEECARRQRNILLVSLPGPELEQTANDLATRFSVQVLHYGIDLTEDNGPETLYQWCQEQALSIDVLINNVGCGVEGAFDNASTDVNRNMVRLNGETLICMSRLFLPMLKAHSHSYMLNISSMAGLHPVPYKSVYAATKALIYSFSRGLREELRYTPVSVSVVCPGGVATNSDVTRRIREQHGFAGRLSLMSVEKVASQSLNGLFARKALIVPGFINRMYTWVSPLIPNRLRGIIARRVFNHQDNPEPEEAPVGKEVPTSSS